MPAQTSHLLDPCLIDKSALSPSTDGKAAHVPQHLYLMSVHLQHPQVRVKPLVQLAATPKSAASLRSVYIKQIRELHELLDVEAISEEDFTKHKAKILALMDCL